MKDLDRNYQKKGDSSRSSVRTRATVMAILLIFFCSIFLLAGEGNGLNADTSGDEGNIHWEIQQSATSISTLVLSKKEGATSGDMNDYSSTRPAWESSASWSFVTKLQLEDGITSIGACAFQDCIKLTGTLEIPDTVTSIGTSAFNGCSGFTGDLTLPYSATSIGANAFFECTGFNGTLMLSNSLKEIGASAFNGCKNITGTLTIPDSVTTIGNNAFKDCQNISKLIIGTKVKTIGNSAFLGCCKVTEIAFNSDSWTVSSISTTAFALGNGTKVTCQVYSTDNCANGKLDSYKDGYTTFIYSNLSEGDDGNIHWAINNGVLTLSKKSGASAGTMNDYTKDNRPTWESLHIWSTVSTLVIDSSVTTIGNYAFYECDGLVGALSIPVNVISIGTNAFEGCTGFEGTLSIPSGIISIGAGAFKGCTGFEGHLEIPASVTSIGDNAFEGCSGFTSATIDAKGIGKEAFKGCSSLLNIVFGGNLNALDSTAFSSHKFYDSGSETELVQNVENMKSRTFIGSSITKMIRMDPTKSHKITFNVDGGSVEKDDKELNEGAQYVVEGYSGTKEGYSFGGWSYNSKTYMPGNIITMGTSNIELKIVWISPYATHHVIYDKNGGSGDAPTQDDVREGLSFTVKAYSGTKSGYTFGGWSYNGTVYQTGAPITMGTSDITLVAIWNGGGHTSHSVTYLSNGGSSPAPTQTPVAEGSSFVVKAYSGTKTGYTFGGWEYDGRTYMPGMLIVMGTSNITLVAVWTPVTPQLHHVTYETEGGSAPAPVQSDVLEAVPFIVKSYSGTKTGFTFAGWSYNGTEYHAGDMIVMGNKDITLRAIWDEHDPGVIEYDSDTDDVTIPGDDIKEIIAKAYDDPNTVLRISLDDCIIDFDCIAISQLKEADTKVSCVESEVEIPDLKTDRYLKSVVYDISAGDNHFGKGKITVTLPFELDPGMYASNLVALYVDSGDIKERVDCTYGDGGVTFTTNHLSTYAIAYENPDYSSGGDLPILLIVAIIVAVIACIAGAVYYVKYVY